MRGALGTKKRTYIVKPEDGSQGDGIFLIQGARELEKLSTRLQRGAVCQRYLEKPLLLGGLKFDLRLYVLVAGGSAADIAEQPPAVFLCREGLARFCTETYKPPTEATL